MSRYENEEYGNPSMRQKDIVLTSNEYAYILNKTTGAIKVYTGPTVAVTSQQDSLMLFDEKTKRFKEINNFDTAKQLFVSAPEGWYIILKNPTEDNRHPETGKGSQSPELKIGKKINISGPDSFALYPGQMAKIVQGHRLRSNQYLLARVYDAEAAEKNIESATIIDAEGKETKTKETKYHVGQLLVIKGTDVSFYMPPTGIEVLAVDKKDGKGGKEDRYIRDAVTLENLEYAILKSENGEKRYVHGPAVVFPEPTEVFIKTPKGKEIFRALELSPISGIYVKVIAPYSEKKGDKTIKHKVGEEIFITGNDQMIYYPRPEHALISYDGKYMHHAIAIPEGEGRYIINRLTGTVKTVKGPAMYLPNPKEEIVLKRKLSVEECNLFYPNNTEALQYNIGLTEKEVERLARMGDVSAVTDAINCAYTTSNQSSTLAIFEANANISRGTSYTKPRTITLDTKYEGAVTINVWDGYAVRAIKKNGESRVIVGPQTVLLDYDETLDTFINECNKKDVYLKVKDKEYYMNAVGTSKDTIDFIFSFGFKVNFLEGYENIWFNTKDHNLFRGLFRPIISSTAKNFTIKELYENPDVLKKACVGEDGIFTVEEFGIVIYDFEIVDFAATNEEIQNTLTSQIADSAKMSLELAHHQEQFEKVNKILELEVEEDRRKKKAKEDRINFEKEIELARLEKEESIQMRNLAIDEARTNAEAAMQPILSEIQKAQLERDKEADKARIETENELLEIEKAKQAAYAETIAKIMESVSPGLIEALSAKANSDMLETVSKGIAPYAIAKDEPISDFVNKLLRGTTLESVIDKSKLNVEI